MCWFLWYPGHLSNTVKRFLEFRGLNLNIIDKEISILHAVDQSENFKHVVKPVSLCLLSMCPCQWGIIDQSACSGPALARLTTALLSHRLVVRGGKASCKRRAGPGPGLVLKWNQNKPVCLCWNKCTTFGRAGRVQCGANGQHSGWPAGCRVLQQDAVGTKTDDHDEHWHGIVWWDVPRAT